jgi:hypothetical protein
MTDKKIELIKKQLENLDRKDFNLEAWKTSTKLVLERIFGGSSPKIREIDKIHYDLSSWTMRDTMGTSSTMDTCKRTARAILETSILELETLGEEEAESGEGRMPVSVVINALEQEMTIAQLRELKEMVKVPGDPGKLREPLAKLFDKMGPPACMRILSSIVSHPELTSKIR